MPAVFGSSTTCSLLQSARLPGVIGTVLNRMLYRTDVPVMMSSPGAVQIRCTDLFVSPVAA